MNFAYLNTKRGQHASFFKRLLERTIQAIDIEVCIVREIRCNREEVNKVRRPVNDDAGNVKLDGVAQCLRCTFWMTNEAETYKGGPCESLREFQSSLRRQQQTL
eukprot:4785660-Pleurochrysis_carterae.AAC.1